MTVKKNRVSCWGDESILKLILVVITPFHEHTQRNVKKKKKLIATITRIEKVVFDKSHG